MEGRRYAGRCWSQESTSRLYFEAGSTKGENWYNGY
jgi:hypothetical protein